MRLFTMLLSLSLSVCGMAQSPNAKELKKIARKEAKKYQKEGWQVPPGSLPLDMQLERAYTYQMNPEEYVKGEGRSKGQVYDAAKSQAIEVARIQLVSLICSKATGKVDNLLENKQLANDQATSISTLIEKSKAIFSQKLGRLQTVVELYRVLGNGNQEVQVQLFAKESDIQRIANDALREELQKRNLLTPEIERLLSATK